MRKLLSFILFAAMLVGGTTAAIFELWYADVIFFRFVIGGGALAFVGAYSSARFSSPKIGLQDVGRHVTATPTSCLIAENQWGASNV